MEAVARARARVRVRVLTEGVEAVNTAREHDDHEVHLGRVRVKGWVRAGVRVGVLGLRARCRVRVRVRAVGSGLGL